MFTRAIVRTPAHSLQKGITTAKLGSVDYAKALSQHAQYVAALKACGLQLEVLPALEDFPDSVFVEDTALLSKHGAIVTNPGASSRKGEVKTIHALLKQFYHPVYEITAPATIEAGDIMMVGSHFYIGLSQRTNQAGFEQMTAYLNQLGLTGSLVKMNEFLHLKTGLSYLENNNLLITGEFVGREEFAGFNQIVINEQQAYAANSVWINDTVLVVSGFPDLTSQIKHLGYHVIELEMSEFQKLDGGLSCLSLRF